MKTDAKTWWLEALRSGNFAQTRNHLRLDEEHVSELGRDYVFPQGYCCLGVLCEVLVDHAGIVTGLERVDTASGLTAGTYRLPNPQYHQPCPPGEAWDWSAHEEFDYLEEDIYPMLDTLGMTIKQMEALVELNDQKRATFGEIADWIEKNL